jgi:hypothetical protein
MTTDNNAIPLAMGTASSSAFIARNSSGHLLLMIAIGLFPLGEPNYE